MPEDAYDPAHGRYPVEDGPGSGRRVELTVRVLVGTERSTVIVDDPVTGRALVHQVVPHESEPGAAAAAVASLVGDRVTELQGGDPERLPGPKRPVPSLTTAVAAGRH